MLKQVGGGGAHYCTNLWCMYYLGTLIQLLHTQEPTLSLKTAGEKICIMLKEIETLSYLCYGANDLVHLNELLKYLKSIKASSFSSTSKSLCGIGAKSTHISEQREPHTNAMQCSPSP